MNELEKIKVNIYKRMREHKNAMKQAELDGDRLGMVKFHRQLYEEYKEELTLMSN